MGSIVVAIITGIISSWIVTQHYFNCELERAFLDYTYDLYLHYKHIIMLAERNMDRVDEVLWNLEIDCPMKSILTKNNYYSRYDMTTIREINGFSEDLISKIKRQNKFTVDDLNELKRKNNKLLIFYNDIK